jgi:hypothetical protein
MRIALCGDVRPSRFVRNLISVVAGSGGCHRAAVGGFRGFTIERFGPTPRVRACDHTVNPTSRAFGGRVGRF